MKYQLWAMMFAMMFVVAGISYAEDVQCPFAAQAAASATDASADKQSLGAQAGEVARDLKGTANESLSTGAMKVAESSKKVEAEVQDTMKTLQQQWDVLAKQLEEKTKQIQAQLQQQWQDFNKSLNKPKQ
jgi:flagellar motility protein MotE (MotC chaperone)